MWSHGCLQGRPGAPPSARNVRRAHSPSQRSCAGARSGSPPSVRSPVSTSISRYASAKWIVGISSGTSEGKRCSHPRQFHALPSVRCQLRWPDTRHMTPRLLHPPASMRTRGPSWCHRTSPQTLSSVRGLGVRSRGPAVGAYWPAMQPLFPALRRVFTNSRMPPSQPRRLSELQGSVRYSAPSSLWPDYTLFALLSRLSRRNLRSLAVPAPSLDFCQRLQVMDNLRRISTELTRSLRSRDRTIIVNLRRGLGNWQRVVVVCAA